MRGRGDGGRFAAAEKGGFYGVAHEHGDGHGTDAAGNGSEGAGGVEGVGMDVANERGAFGVEFIEASGKIAEQRFGFGGIGDFVGADIDHGGTGAEPIGLDVTGFAHGSDDDIGAANYGGEVARLGMADGDGGVGVHEEEGHGFADNVAAAEDDGVGAFDGNIVATEDFHAAGGSAGDEAWAAADQTAQIYGMKAVDVFRGIDGFENALGIDLGREGKLNQNAVHVIVVVEVAHKTQHLVGGDGGGRGVHPTGEAELFGGGNFGLDVKLRSRILADEHCGQTGADSLRDQERDFSFQFDEDFVADLDSVKDACGHSWPLSSSKENDSIRKYRERECRFEWRSDLNQRVYDKVLSIIHLRHHRNSAMLRTMAYWFLPLPIACSMLFPAIVSARQATGARDPSGAGGLEGMIPTASLDVYVQGPNGAPVESLAVVTLTTLAGQTYRQGTTKGGYVRFNDLAATEYRVHVVAPAYARGVSQVEAIGFATKRVVVVLQPRSDSGDATLASMKPKAQKEMAKALEALRVNKPIVARTHLDAVDQMAPNRAEVNYLLGVSASQLNDETQATAYWTKALQINPKHFQTLLALSETAVRNQTPNEAVGYLKQAIETEPSAWRAHALLAEAYYLQHSCDETIKEAERAMDLGHGQAATLQPLLARCLVERGEKERAISILQAYGQDHPTDTAAKKQLERLQNPTLVAATSEAVLTSEIDSLAVSRVAEALPSSWMPPSIDDQVPPVEAGASCALEEVVQNAGKRLQELVKNVDRFTATEFVSDQSINKWGQASNAERAQFDYIVSMQETHPGALSVEEYRERRTASKEFPEAVVTNGLPAMVVIFHPYYAGNYEMTCEGLARWNGGLAWQVHFRQRKDKPNTIRSYRSGLQGQGNPVALKGRAWIAADNYQVVRLETDMVAPMPQIRLAAEHINIEYAPVRFRHGELEMWLPASVEVYSDWKGHRTHRQHRFSNYLLFSVDDKQKIYAPKVRDAPDNEQPN